MRLGAVQAENGPTRHVIAGSGLIVDTVGEPIVSENVQRELLAIDPGLKIEYLEAAWGMSGFVLKKRWGPNDPRWATVQSGETPKDKAFDVEHKFPPDCRTDDMVAYIRNRWGERNIPADPRAVAEKMIADAQKMLRDADAAVPSCNLSAVEMRLRLLTLTL